MLAIEVELLTGRYIATAYNDRQEAEWPPHPARLFSALVAAHFAEDAPSAEERAALEWLEEQGAPSIRATPASRREVVTVFVPVNDAAMTNVDNESSALEEARAAVEEARAKGEAKAVRRTTAALKKAETKLANAIAASVHAPAKGGNPVAAMRVLPEHRVRQPRTFPSVTPEEPKVTFVWPGASPTTKQLDAMEILLRRVVRLGHSSSFVAARLVDRPVTPVWRPAPGGELILRTMQGGHLVALERAYLRHRETEPRLMPARFETYTKRTVHEEVRLARSWFSDDWLVVRRVGGPSLPMSATAGLARSVRKALMSHAREIPEILSGHASEGTPSERAHLAIVPLSFVGHSHATGSILGVALILPRAVSDAERRAVFAAVDEWESVERREDEDIPRLSVTLGRAGILELERIEWGAAQATLRPATWCRPASVWLSVTPVALDRNPGDLQARDPRKLAAAVAEAQETIRLACGRVGLPDPVDVEVLPAPPFAGAAKARQYPPFPEEPGRTRRVLTHCRVAFGEPVSGPILLGAGRYLGVGLFRPGDLDV